MKILRNAQFISKTLKNWMPRFEFLFGCKVLGIEKLKSKQYLCVANHNIGVLVEGFTLLNAWQKHFNNSQVCYAMAHPFFFNFPGVGYVMKRLGCIPASYEASQIVIKNKDSVLVFPGGNYEAIRSYFDRELCDFKQRKGWLKIALRNNLEIVPISIVGSHSVNPVFYRSKFLSYFLILPIVFRIKWFPISLAQIVYATVSAYLCSFFLPLWAVILVSYFAYMFAFLIPILPGRIQMKINDPIDISSLNTSGLPLSELSNDPLFLQKCYDHVTSVIQSGMDTLNLKTP